jgi:hypothetical protein
VKKIDFNAKSEYDMINNYKVLQEAFTKLGIDKVCVVCGGVCGCACVRACVGFVVLLDVTDQRSLLFFCGVLF